MLQFHSKCYIFITRVCYHSVTNMSSCFNKIRDRSLVFSHYYHVFSLLFFYFLKVQIYAVCDTEGHLFSELLIIQVAVIQFI